MSAQSFEYTLAKLYTDQKFRNTFLKDPNNALKNCELTNAEVQSFVKIDKAGLIMASNSFYHKRMKRKKQNFFIRLISYFRSPK